MLKFYVLLLFFFFTAFLSHAQTNNQPSIDSLKTEIINLQTDVRTIKLNLGKVENRFKTGIFISTIGYSVVITGGLMLGRKNDELGKVLLVAGGITGVTGTILMVDAFKFLGIASGQKKRHH